MLPYKQVADGGTLSTANGAPLVGRVFSHIEPAKVYLAGKDQQFMWSTASRYSAAKMAAHLGERRAGRQR